MSHKRYNIVAYCFDKKGRVLSTGRNSYTKTHPLMQHFAVKAEKNELKNCLHAEISAILRAKDKEIHRILVQRVEKLGFGMAKPCKTCECAIRAFGIKIVEYTTDEGIESYETTNS